MKVFPSYYSEVSMDDRFITFAMFRPAGGEWVPLQKLNWDFFISAHSDGQIWTEDPHPTLNIGRFEDTRDHPVWNFCHPAPLKMVTDET
jgi:hypothetical protein